ncbi:hypothetical protein WH367_16475 [Comamonas sp. MYb21]|uniref:hypothetical protein n=1 Tax=Comamonas sp. MYb21 TaxID=1848648 RepID=UPI0030A3E3CB
MPTKKFTSPGRTYRRSQVALMLGLLALAIATGFAIQFDVRGGDLFSGLMAGAGAIGALMAAYESADAAEGAADAARISNELTKKQFLPSIFVFGLHGEYEEVVNSGTRCIYDLMDIGIHNVGHTYTSVKEWRLDIYLDMHSAPRTFQRYYQESVKPNSTVLIRLDRDLRKECNFANIQAYALQISTIHGTRHGCIAIVNGSKRDVISRQLAEGEKVPAMFPFTLGVEAEQRL